MRPSNINDLDPPNTTDVSRLFTGLAALFSMIAVLAIVDVAADLSEGTDFAHVAVELLVAAAGLVGAGVLARSLLRARRDTAVAEERAEALERALDETRAEAHRWRESARDLMRGLGEAIDDQFQRWELSPAEREVALLLLKGLSHKEVANVRGITVATARQQAAAVYKKAGIGGKQELLAFFLEDLMLPSQEDDSAGLSE
jgi:DNA-binding CsgD family transcriptional regulator